jgi:hypothetical protein
MTRVLRTGILLFGLAAPAWHDDFLHTWSLQAEAGYTRPGGRIGDTFGSGAEFGWSFGRRLSSGVSGEAGFLLGSVGYADAQTVNGPVCLPVTAGHLVCPPGPVLQRGGSTAFLLGISAHRKAGGRVLQAGAGGLFERYSVSPGGEALGSRSGPGIYATVGGDLFPIGGVGGVGLLLRGEYVSTRGKGQGILLPSRTHDTWMSAGLLVRLGREKGQPP